MADRNRAKQIRILVGFGVTIAICIWLYQSTNWSSVGEQLRQLHRWDMLLAASLAYALQIVLRAIRWRYLLAAAVAHDDVPSVAVDTQTERPAATIWLLVDGVMVGNLGNYLLPLRAGEFLRPYVVAREAKLGYLTCFVSTIVERFFDLFVVLSAFGLILLKHQELPLVFYQAAVFISALAVAILLFIVVCTLFPEWLQRTGHRLMRRLPPHISRGGERFLADFLAGTRVLRRPQVAVGVLVLSWLVWIATAWQYYVLLVSCNIAASAWFATTITVMIALAVAAPSSPGFIGVFQVACIAAFAIYGQAKDMAVTYAIVSHSLQYVLVCGYGVVVIARHGVPSWRTES